MISEKQLKANKKNAQNAGRPIASKTLTTQLQRKMLVVWLEPRLSNIFNALADKAEKGDVSAARELFDRAWGKSAQPLWHGDSEGKPLVVSFDATFKNQYATPSEAEIDSRA